jgi:hypothetical protein
MPPSVATPGALEYYKEHVAHGRHTETQRSTVAGLTFAFAGVIIGKLLEKAQLTGDLLPYTVTLCLVGIFTLLLTAKLYERFKLHNTIAKYARNAYDPSLATFRQTAESEHKKNFPHLYEMKLHIIWNSFFVIISTLGLGWTLAILIFGA